MGNYEVHVNGRSIGRGDNFNHPTEAQYYAFDATDAVKAGEPLALGAMYHYWTCTCQGRANGPISNTTLAAAQAVGATNLRVGSMTVFDVGDQITVGTGALAETTTVTAIGTAGASGTGITSMPALQIAHAQRPPGARPRRPVGPDPEGRRRPRRRQPRDVRQRRHLEGPQGRRSTRTPRSRAATATPATAPSAMTPAASSRAGTRPASTTPIWQPAYAIGPHPRPLNPLRETFSHLDPAITDLDYETVKPEELQPARRRQRRRRLRPRDLRDAADRVRERHAGRQVVVQTSYRLNNTTLAAAAAPGDTIIKVASVGNFVAGDRITVDQAANGYGKGDPETRTITAVGTAGASGTGITLDAPLGEAHADRPLRRGLARRHQHARHAGLQPRLVVHAEGRRADRPGLHLLGLALPAGPAAGAGETLTRR